MSSDRFKRNGLITQIPIALGSFPSAKALLYPVLVTAVTGSAMYLYQQRKRNSKHTRTVMVKRQKDRLIEERAAFNIRVNDLREHLQEKV